MIYIQVNDELKIYRGKDFVVSESIIIHQPTLNEIVDYGEQDFFLFVNTFVATPQSLKAQLWDMGIDYTNITAYELFCHILCKLYPMEKTSILFSPLDFTKFTIMKRSDSDELFLYQIDQNNKEIIIDEYTYGIITDLICSTYNIEKDEKIPANESTKMALIEDAKEELIISKTRKYHSNLKNLISALVNSEGFKYNHLQVWDMKINAFMDSVKRISHIKNANILLQSGYSGFGINLEKIDKEQLNWMGELN